MRLGEAIFLVQQRLGGAEDLGLRVQAEMALAKSKIEQLHPKPWYLLTTDVTIEVGEEGYFFLPTDFLSEYEDPLGRGSMWVKGAAGTKQLVRGDYAKLFAEKSIESSEPTQYDIIGNTVFVFPIPDKTYEVIFLYYKMDGELASPDIETPILKYSPDLLIGMTGVAMATYTQDRTALETFAAESSAARDILFRDTVHRQQVNRPVTLGGEL